MNDLEKWRLILGKFSKDDLPVTLTGDKASVEALLDSVYDSEYTGEKGMYGNQSSGHLVIKHLKNVETILNQTTVHKIATDAFESYGMYEVLGDDQYLKKATPDIDLLKNLILYKDYSREEDRKKIRYKIKQIAEAIKKELMADIDLSRIATIHKTTGSKYTRSKYIDIKKTIEKNIKNYDKDREKLYVEDIYFYPNKGNIKPRDVILLVDCSGSMLKSLIYVAILSSIFYNISGIRIKIVLFDTRIVNFSDLKEDPIDILLDVQLGGGTDVALALNYGKSIIDRPDKSICLVITDLFSEEVSMLKAFENMKDTGSKTLVLTGIEDDGKSYYNKNFSKKLEKIGISVESVTIKELAHYIKGSLK